MLASQVHSLTIDMASLLEEPYGYSQGDLVAARVKSANKYGVADFSASMLQ